MSVPIPIKQERNIDEEETDHSMVDQNYLVLDSKMFRVSHPSTEQVEVLLDFLEAHPNMAKGFSKSAAARQSSRREWARIANTLNSIGGGCIKTDKKWIKYWNDKKGFVKKKDTARARARSQTGGSNAEEAEVPELTELEERIVTLMCRQNCAVGDSHHKAPHNQPRDSSVPGPTSSDCKIVISPVPRPSEMTNQHPKEQDSTPDHIIPGPSGDQISLRPVIKSEPSGNVDSVKHNISNGVPSPPSDQPPPPLFTSIPSRRRRRRGPHSRLTTALPPLYRSSQLTTVANRFLQLERRRLDLEERTIVMWEQQMRNNQTLLEAIGRLGTGMTALASALNRNGT